MRLETPRDLIPMELTSDRTFPVDYEGPLYCSDIDGTYLQTDLSSAAGMLAIPFEFAIDKVAVPGAVALLRGLRHGKTERSALHPLYFVSASPPQLRRVIERKMTLDGVEFDGIAFKDQLRMLFARRVREITHQVAYKLGALFRYRTLLPAGARWTLFGDDLEADAEIFALFADGCAGLRGRDLAHAIESLGTRPDAAQFVAALADGLPRADPVEGVHIRLARRAGAVSWLGPARPLPDMGGRLVAAADYLTLALVLHRRGHLRPEAVRAVARAILEADPRLSLEELLSTAEASFPVDRALGDDLRAAPP